MHPYTEGTRSPPQVQTSELCHSNTEAQGFNAPPPQPQKAQKPQARSGEFGITRPARPPFSSSSPSRGGRRPPQRAREKAPPLPLSRRPCHRGSTTLRAAPRPAHLGVELGQRHGSTAAAAPGRPRRETWCGRFRRGQVAAAWRPAPGHRPRGAGKRPGRARPGCGACPTRARPFPAEEGGGSPPSAELRRSARLRGPQHPVKARVGVFMRTACTLAPEVI